MEEEREREIGEKKEKKRAQAWVWLGLAWVARCSRPAGWPRSGVDRGSWIENEGEK